MIVAGYKFCQRRRRLTVRRTPIDRLASIDLHLAGAHLLLQRCHRRLNGASTLTRKKEGRRKSFSKTLSSQISVVTHRCCHRLVMKSTSSSTLVKAMHSGGLVRSAGVVWWSVSTYDECVLDAPGDR